MQYKTILFDLDGTLTDSAPGILNSVRYGCRKLGLPVPDDATLRRFLGPPLIDSFRNPCGLSAADADRAVAAFREYFPTKGIFENEVYPGIPAMLADLHARGCQLVLATSKPEEYARRIMAHFDLEPYFTAICGATLDETRTDKAEVIAYALETIALTDKNDIGFPRLPIRSCENQPLNAKINETIVGDVRIVPHGNAFFIELTYQVACSTSILLDGSRACLVDVGLRNIVTLASTISGIHPVVVKGGMLKSINAKYNKDAASLQTHGKQAHRRSKVMKRICRINDNLHKVSRFVVKFCLQHDLGTIVIGHNDGWKQNVNLGKVNNQNFVSIPFNRLIHMIRYKAEEYGIKVIVREESYTSRQSALDFDPLPNYGDKNANQVLSTGRRVRGLFFRSNGQVINSDVNGCLNIGRKEFGDDWLKKLVETDKGCLMQPVTVRIGQ